MSTSLDLWILVGLFALALVVAFGRALPRFSAYFLGPAFLTVGGLAFISLHKYFFPFQSDGSIAGLIVPGIMWIGFITCCILGCALIIIGRGKIKEKVAAAPPDRLE